MGGACFVMGGACFVMGGACFVMDGACFVMGGACFVMGGACFVMGGACFVMGIVSKSSSSELTGAMRAAWSALASCELSISTSSTLRSARGRTRRFETPDTALSPTGSTDAAAWPAPFAWPAPIARPAPIAEAAAVTSPDETPFPPPMALPMAAPAAWLAVRPSLA